MLRIQIRFWLIWRSFEGPPRKCRSSRRSLCHKSSCQFCTCCEALCSSLGSHEIKAQRPIMPDIYSDIFWHSSPINHPCSGKYSYNTGTVSPHLHNPLPKPNILKQMTPAAACCSRSNRIGRFRRCASPEPSWALPPQVGLGCKTSQLMVEIWNKRSRLG